MSSSAMGLEADISRCQQLFEAKELVAEVVVSNTKHRDRNERTWEGKEAQYFSCKRRGLSMRPVD